MIESKLSPDVGRCEVHVCGKTSNKDTVFKLEEVIARWRHCLQLSEEDFRKIAASRHYDLREIRHAER